MTLAAPLWLLAIPAVLVAAVAIARATARRRAALPGSSASSATAQPLQLGAESLGDSCWSPALRCRASIAWKGRRRVRPSASSSLRSVLAEDEEGSQSRAPRRASRAATRFARALQIFRRALVPMEGRQRTDHLHRRGRRDRAADDRPRGAARAAQQGRSAARPRPGSAEPRPREALRVSSEPATSSSSPTVSGRRRGASTSRSQRRRPSASCAAPIALVVATPTG